MSAAPPLIGEPPSSQTYPLYCRKCRFLWTGYLLTNVAVEVWVAHARAMHCPDCGADWDQLSLVPVVAQFREHHPDAREPAKCE